MSTLKSEREFTVPPPIILSEVMDGKKLSFSSSEMSSLAMCLPLVLGEFVSSDNPYYANLLLLFEIVMSLQCYSFSEEQLIILEKMIEIHISNFVLLYPKSTPRTNVDSANTGKSITLKLHSLLHFPAQIRQFGAPRYSWCFRYEQKNAPFKKIMRRNSNFHNVPWTMASHHQRLVCLDIKSDGEGNFFGKSNEFAIQIKKSSMILVKNAWWSKMFLEATGLSGNLKCRLLKKINISGRICQSGTVFLRKLPIDENHALFFRITNAINCDEGTFLIMEKLTTCSFCHDRLAFIVQPKKSFLIVSPEKLSFNVPLHSFFYCHDFHVIPNYYHLL